MCSECIGINDWCWQQQTRQAAGEDQMRMDPQVEYIARISRELGDSQGYNREFLNKIAELEEQKGALQSDDSSLRYKISYLKDELEGERVITTQLKHEIEVLTKKLAKLQPKKTVKKEKKGKK